MGADLRFGRMQLLKKAAHVQLDFAWPEGNGIDRVCDTLYMMPDAPKRKEKFIELCLLRSTPYLVSKTAPRQL